MMERVLKKNDLMILLNEIKQQGIESFTVKEQFFNTELLHVEIENGYYNVKLASRDDFGPFPDKEKYFNVDDLPGYKEYIECLISSGLLNFDNWNKFIDWLEYMYKSEIDPSLSSKSVFLSIDTNMAYYRLISRRFPINLGDHVIHASDFDYLLSSIVENEIDHRIENKYDHSALKMMGMYTKIGDLRFNFRNRGTLRTRKAKFATQELNYLRGELNAARVKGQASKRNSERNDIRIVESLENFSWSKNIDVALISSDRNMGNHAENSEIPYFVLEMPTSLKKNNKVKSDVVLNLLHDLSLFYGAVKLPELKTTLFGIWGGKRDIDYKNESVRAWVNPGASFVDEVQRDLDVIESLSEPREDGF
ncbi:MAG: PIN domain-containing protein [Thermoplasmatota archaeon]